MSALFIAFKKLNDYKNQARLKYELHSDQTNKRITFNNQIIIKNLKYNLNCIAMFSQNLSFQCGEKLMALNIGAYLLLLHKC